jgi:hypothetical protein
VCAEGAPLANDCTPCSLKICSIDPSCCDKLWGPNCVADAANICGECGMGTGGMGGAGGFGGSGAGGAGGVCGDMVCNSGESCETCPIDCGPCPTCSHSECSQGTPLNGTCSPCAAAVCNQDPFCCSSKWDNVCVADAQMKCGTLCTGGTGGAGGGAAGGSSTGGTTGAGGGSQQACLTCAQGSCGPQIQTCLGAPGCQNCLFNPLTPGCSTNPAFIPVAACVCGSCSGSCQGILPCP